LLSQSHLLSRLPVLTTTQVVCLDTQWKQITNYSGENLPRQSEPMNLAYVIYTSGSTGQPKGVAIEHHNTVALLNWAKDVFTRAQIKGVLASTSICFDLSIFEIFVPLCWGGSSIVVENALFLPDLSNNIKITLINTVPSAIAELVRNNAIPTSVSVVNLAGEALQNELVQKIYQRETVHQVFNLYGPSEDTTYSTVALMKKGDLTSPTIGHPIANTQIYILDNYLQPTAIGIPGELHIGGAGLARGYLNRPELTASKFIPNPFSDIHQARLYQTGDLARYLPNGQIEYLGRLDNQVKIRGFRIELGEIEAILSQYPAVQENIVIVVPTALSNHKQLVAYLVPDSEHVFENFENLELRRFLQEKLPDYMIPSAFVTLDALPLMPNGKVDRQTLSQWSVNREVSEKNFVPPHTPEEELLAEIWSSVLGVSRVGIHDNFFELGGDSILSIQVISRANQSGLSLTPKQLFQHQTIAELATVVGNALTPSAEQGLVTGAVPLTPIQYWFLEQKLPEPHHFNQAVLLEVSPNLTPEMLEIIMYQWLQHHDALRLRFKSKEGIALSDKDELSDDKQWITDDCSLRTDDDALILVKGLTGFTTDEQRTIIESTATELQASLNLSNGPLVRMSLFQLATEQPQRLLFIIHHLAVDGVSWRILLEDFSTAYQQLSQGDTIVLPQKTTSFKQWAERVTEYALSEVLLTELEEYWLATERWDVKPLPVDFSSNIQANTVASSAQIKVSLSIEHTQSLLNQVPPVYHTQINEVLLAALVQSFAQWTGQATLLIDLEGHGRETLFEDIDLSRTVGWFTSLFPVFLDLGQKVIPSEGELLKSIKEQLRQLPQRGIGYGLLRYLNPNTASRLSALPPAQVSFNYLGQFQQTLSTTPFLGHAKESSGIAHSMLGQRTHLIDINGLLHDGQLQMTWTYSQQVHKQSTIECLAQDFIKALQALIVHCQLPEAGGYTPSDFNDVALSQKQLDQLLKTIELENQFDSIHQKDAIEAIYPLSPSQQGMLIETLSMPHSGIHIEQSIWRLHGDLALNAFEQAWEKVVKRHSVLRTTFVWQEIEESLSVVLRGVKVQLEQQDLRGIASEQQQEKLENYLKTQRFNGFNLTQAPIMRLAVFQIDNQAYDFVWTHHHILIDGWCINIIRQEVISYYEAYCHGQTLSLEPVRPYRDYIHWLKQQDLSIAEKFWRQTLQGFTQPTPLGTMVDADENFSTLLKQKTERYGKQQTNLSVKETATLHSLVKQYRLTLNTVIQGVWALLLSRYSDESDVVFGATVSGRPADLTGVESMIGLFINTLPMRVKVTASASLWSWLKEVQTQNQERHSYEYCSAGQIHQWSGMSGVLPLYESILVFENYPTDNSDIQRFSKLGFEIGEGRSLGAQTQYVLTLMVIQDSQLSFQMIYDRYRFDDLNVTLILEHFLKLLKSILVGQDTKLSTFTNQISVDEIPKVRSLGAREESFIAPRNTLELQLVQIWEDILNVHPIGVHDNFFQRGGHSLLATQLISKIRDILAVELPLHLLFESPTIAELSNQIETFLRKQSVGTEGMPISLPTIVFAPEQRDQSFPLTEIQQAYWLGSSGTFELGNVATHGYVELDCDGLDLKQLNRAWQMLIKRHEMLRMVILPTGQQQILPQVPPYQIKLLNLCGQTPDIIATELEAIRQQMSHQVLSTADQWPLFEIRATRLDKQRIRLHLSYDAMIADAWGMQILAKEWLQLYQNTECQLTPLTLSFRDYVLAEQAWQKTEGYQHALAYWLNRLETLPPAPELPLAQNPTTLTQPKFQRRSAQLDLDNWQQLKQRASQAGLTPSGVLLAAFAEILTAWSKQPRLTVNLTLFNRLPIHSQINDIIGDFTSLLLVAVDNSIPDTFTNRARRIQQQLWEDLEHRYVSGVRVQRELARQRGDFQKATMPIVFTSTLTLNFEQQDSLEQLGEVVYSISQTPQVWLDHQVSEVEGQLVFLWDAVEALFPPGLLDDMFAAYSYFLQQLANSDSAWQDTPMLVPSTHLLQRSAVNATEAPVYEVLLHTLFTDKLPTHGHEYAVISPQRRLTYLELSQLANQVGIKLRQLGASPNTLVAIVMEKGWEQIVAVLGVLMSGAAYLPIDPELPKERQWYLLEQGKIKLVLTQSQFNQQLTWPVGIQRLCLDNDDFSTIENTPLEIIQKPTDLAYVIFTSGSTGQPKGVMIDHRGAVNTIKDINQRFGVSSQDRVLALSALSFDLSVYDIFGILAVGGTIIIPDAQATKEPAHWLELINQHQVTLWNTVPALMQMLVDYIGERSQPMEQSLRLILMSGDWIPLNLPERIKSLWPDTKVISLGGATEASIWSIYYPIEIVEPTWKSIPYGKPLTNQTFHVLNELLDPCPVWVPGQLYIGGIGLALGYWRDKEKTHNSFIIHPRTQERLYKTGDLGRYLPDGQIEFLGREDFQVKIHGYRIELGEIETALQQHRAIKNAVVNVVGESAKNQQLVAYLVPHQNQEEDYVVGETKEVILDPVERLEFKLKQPGLRQSSTDETSISLFWPEFDENLTQTYLERQSYRQFVNEPISLKLLSLLLSSLLQMKVEGAPLPKYRYPSAGNLYPVQTYLSIKPNGVEGLEGGIYYYHPAEHRLILLHAGEGIGENAYGEYGGFNQRIFEQSAFSLFLIGQLNAITPLYGNWAKDFCLLEAGYISQLLMEMAPKHEIGLCPIGNLDFETNRALFSLEDSQILLHSFLGGKIALTQTQQWLQSAHQSVSITEALHHYLEQKLPAYMIPSTYIRLDALPLTANGKVNRNALPSPNSLSSNSDKGYVAPRTPTEEILVTLWSGILKVEPIGIYDNFFELGGDSLLATRFITQVRNTLQMELQLRDFLEKPTVIEFAQRIETFRILTQNIQKSTSNEMTNYVVKKL